MDYNPARDEKLSPIDLCKLTVSCGSVLNRGSGRFGLAKRQGMCPSSRLYSPPTLPKR
jgi:hypothetical protein